MNEEFSGPQKKWKPGGNPPEIYDSSETRSAVSSARLQTGESKGLIRGEVSNFDSRPAEHSKDTNWLTWSFVLQLYDAKSGERTKSYSVRMKFVAGGQLINGHVVEVHGKLKNGVFLASKIEDTVTGAITYPAIGETTFRAGRSLLIVICAVFGIAVVAGMIYGLNQWIATKNRMSGSSVNGGWPPQGPRGGGTLQGPSGPTLTSNATFANLVSEAKSSYQEAIEACEKHTPANFDAKQCERHAQMEEESRLKAAEVGHYGNLPKGSAPLN